MSNEQIIGKIIPVLDHGWVTLTDMMPSPLRGVTIAETIASTARTSTSASSKGKESDYNLLRYMLTHEHSTPFEFVQFNFTIFAPLMVLWQLVRYRTQSINSQSGRYTEFTEGSFYAPEEWRRQSGKKHQGSDGLIDPEEAAWLTQQLEKHYNNCYELYTAALERGVERGLARVFLPGFSTYYRWTFSINLWNFMRVVRQRVSDEAQLETRVFIQAIYDQVLCEIEPDFFDMWEKIHPIKR